MTWRINDMDRSRPLTPLAMLLGGGTVQGGVADIAAASHHRLELLLFQRLLTEDPHLVPTRTRAEMVGMLEIAAAHNQNLIEELLRILARLDEAGIPALPLKGPVLAWMLWDDLRVRRCRDLDLLVPQDRIADAVLALAGLGYQAESRVGGLRREIHLEHEAGAFVLDLHWNVVFGEMPLPLDFAELWADRRRLRWKDTQLPVLGPEWLFVVTCLYLVKDYPWPELIYLSDLARLLVVSPDLDWKRVAAIAAHTGTRRICAVGLVLVEALPSANIPERAYQLFSRDHSAVQAIVKRFESTLSCPSRYDPANPLHRVRKILSHTAFRERPADKLRVLMSFLPLLLRPSKEHEAQSWLNASLRRLRELFADRPRLPTLSVRQWLWPSPAGRLLPAPGTSFHPLDNAGILLSAGTRELHALSPGAAFLWCCLEEGLSPRAMARRFAFASGQPIAEARAEVLRLLRTWHEQGLLGAGGDAANASAREATSPAMPLSQPVIARPRSTLARRYKLLDTVFDVYFDTQARLEAVDLALRHLATPLAPTVWVSIISEADTGTITVLIDGAEVDCCADPAILVPAVKSALTTAAVNRHDFAVYLHAAMLRRGKGALLLPAPPQSGKTTLAAVLAKAGFDYSTDEVTLLERDTLMARGASVALTVKESGWLLLQPLYPDLATLPAHRRADGKIVKYVPPCDAVVAEATAYPVRWIVLPRYTPGGPNELRPLSRIEGFRCLMDECLALRLEFDVTQTRHLIQWVAGIEFYTLTFDNLDIATCLLITLCDEKP
jgi:hypothetical protein